MGISSKEYWEQREAEALQHYITDEKEYKKRIDQIYNNMLNNVQADIDAFYGRYASKNGITIAEAKKRVSQADIAAYKFKAKKYVKDKDFSKQANEEMALYNLTMKVNRLELLKANIGLELIAGHDELQKFMGGILKGRTMDELKRQAGILGKTIQNNAKTANAIVNASFYNATFSDRIWQYHDLMKNQLASTLQTGLIQGKNPRAIAGELRKYWYGNDPMTGKGAVYCMERLMRTELARVQTEAQKQSFEANGFEMYTFHTNTGCCPVCARLDGKHIKIEDMMPGKNAPPMHPHCRCSVSAYEDSEEYEQWLDFLANGGTTEEYNKLKAQPKAKQAESKTTFTPAKTISEAEEYAQRFVVDLNARFEELSKRFTYTDEQRESWFRTNRKYEGVVSYKGINVDSANMINETLTKLFDEFNLPKLSNIKTMNFRENLWKSSKERVPAAYRNMHDGELFINPYLYKDKKAMDKYIAEGEKATQFCFDNIDKFTGKDRELIETYKKAGRSLVADSTENKMIANIQHEIGHHIQNQILYKDKEAVKVIKNGASEYAIKISGYATHSTGEYVAESFAAFVNGEADRIDPALKEYFERLLK